MKLRQTQLVTAVAGVLLATGTAFAAPQDFDFSGNFTYDNDVVGFDFTVGASSLVTVFSSSWLSGDPPHGFDPMLGIWDMDAGGALVDFQDDGGNEGSTMSNGVSYDHGVWDSYYQVNLAPGHYRATVVQFDNFNLGSMLSDGFQHDGVDGRNFTYVNGFGGATQPYFNGVWDSNDPRTSYWQFHLLGVEDAVPVIPEPSTYALMALGLGALVVVRKRRRC